MKLKEYLDKYQLITDGSFGTYYAERFETQEMPELANLYHKERVLEIHDSYIEAGAKLIRTNTFATNTISLGANIQEVKENIRAAVAIAQEAVSHASDFVFITGDIGPIPVDGSLTEEQIAEEYYEIAKTFFEEGIEILTFETFPDMSHIETVLKKIKEQSDTFVMVQFSMNQFGYSNSGMSAKKLMQEAGTCPYVDATGFNCGVGPGHMVQILSQIPWGEKYIIALPNAGYPKRVRNRITFSDNPKYFASKVKELSDFGVDIIGGCCGTTPAFIKSVAQIVDVQTKQERKQKAQEKQKEQIPLKKGFLYDENGLEKRKKLIAVELAPPANAQDEKLLEAAHILQKSDVDVVTFPDSPSGRTRIDSVLMAEKVRRETGLAVMPHICCRDKNAIAMRSLFLGAHINDIHNFLIVTGDPVPSMVRSSIKSVFNFDSVGLMKIAEDMNEENFPECPLFYGGAINQGRRNLDVEIMRVKKKMDAGAQFFFTQPVFSQEDAERIRLIKEETGAKILCGIMPLISRRNALFMKNEIAGVPVTDKIVARYPENGTKEEGEKVGVEIACEVINATKDFADGYYFSFPFNKVYLLETILKNVKI